MAKSLDTGIDKKTLIEFNNFVRELGNYPINKDDPNVLDVIKSHCDEYRKLCTEYGITPTWEGLSLALGQPRQTVTQWRDGVIMWAKEQGVTEYLRGEWAYLNSVLVSSMIDGKVDKITGIFYARNNYGYVNEDQEQRRTEVNVHLSMQELIDGAKNLQIEQQKDIKIPQTRLREQEPARKPRKARAKTAQAETAAEA